MTRPNLQQQFVGPDGRLTQEGLRVLIASYGVDAHTHTAADITDFAAAVAALVPVGPLASLTINGTTAAGVTGLAQNWIEIFSAVSAGASAAMLQVAFTNDNGGSWGAWQGILRTSIAAGAYAGGSTFLSLTTGEYVSGYGNNYATSGTLTVPAGCNGIQLRTDVTGSAGKSLIFRR